MNGIKKILVSLFLVTGLFAKAQLTVTSTGNYSDPYWLAENILVDTGFVIFPPSNPPLSGIVKVQPSSQQLGFFKSNGSGFPLDSGIVMSTAHANNVVPGMLATAINPDVAANDADLVTVLNAIGSTNTTLKDKVSIEFSFFALTDSINFNYIFSSEEYSSWTCSNFNDVFGFFLKGPGINGINAVRTVNIATIPNTTVPVAINTINQGFPSNPTNGPVCLAANPNYVAHSMYYNNNSSRTGPISHYGYTDVFTAKAQVQCGNWYEIKLVISDVFDGVVHSAVFLEANSFRSPTVTLTPITNSGNSFSDSNMVEGCFPTKLVIEKPSSLFGKDFGLRISTSGTAVEGVDYNNIPDSIWLAPNQNTDTIFIDPIEDGLVEGIEDVILKIEQVKTGCNFAFKITKVLTITDSDSLDLDLGLQGPDSIVCPQDTAEIAATINGGKGLQNWWWGDDPGAPLIRKLHPNQTTTYTFFLTDECGADTLVDSITIYNNAPSPLQGLTQIFEICRGDEIKLYSDYIGGTEPVQTNWLSGAINDTLIVLPDADSTWFYYVLADACGQNIEDSILVYFTPDEEADFTYQASDDNPLNIQFLSDGSQRISYLWHFGDGDSSTLVAPEHLYNRADDYMVSLKVLSANGCYQTVTKTITVEAIFRLFIPDAFTPNGDGINDAFQIGGVGISKFEMYVFNRWGAQVFHSSDLQDAWDGTFKGSPAPTGTYSFMLQVEDRAGKVHKRRGSFMIIR